VAASPSEVKRPSGSRSGLKQPLLTCRTVK
jgi:hypothetical protein